MSTAQIHDLSKAGYPKVVTAFSGSRDNYQLPLALNESHLLEAFLTDLYFRDKKHDLLSIGFRMLPNKYAQLRYSRDLDQDHVNIMYDMALIFTLKATILKWKLNELNRYTNIKFGQAARILAYETGSALLMYSFYASSAFKPGKNLPDYRFLFSLQAHPKSLRRILEQELEVANKGYRSLKESYEFSLTDTQFEEFSNESAWANGWLVSSSFCKNTLIENGVPAKRIHVVPYGVSAKQVPIVNHTRKDSFTIGYVGSVIQLKGISYLLEAVRKLKSRHMQVRIFTRQLGFPELLSGYDDIDIDIVTGLSGIDLFKELSQLDVFIFPSLGDGFGHVILEAMACGVPVIATTNCCGPDIIQEGVNGFIVPIRDPDAISERIEWCLANRNTLKQFGELARSRAQAFTWKRFRTNLVEAYMKMVDSFDS